MTEALCTVNGAPCAAAHAFLPRGGVWFVELELVDPQAISGRVVVKLGGLELRGTVHPQLGGVFAGRQTVTVVAGAGSWGKVLAPKPAQNDGGVQRSRLAIEAAQEVGEVLVVDSALDGPVGVLFERVAEPASRLLSLLFPNALWWVGTDGVTRVGTRPTFEASGLHLHSFDPSARSVEIRFEGANVTQCIPGARISDPLRIGPGGFTLGDVQITYGREGLRAWSFDRSDRNAVAEAVQTLAAAGDPGRRYHGLYEYRVFNMAGDDKRAQLQIVDKELTGLPDALPVKVRMGVAGASAELKGGSLVLVQFVNGDPARPVVVGFEEEGGPGHVPPELRIDGEFVVIAGGAQFASLANEVQLRIQELATIVTSAVPVSGDGGAGMQLDIKAKLQSVYNWSPTLEPPTVAAEKVKIT